LSEDDGVEKSIPTNGAAGELIKQYLGQIVLAIFSENV